MSIDIIQYADSHSSLNIDINTKTISLKDKDEILSTALTLDVVNNGKCHQQ